MKRFRVLEEHVLKLFRKCDQWSLSDLAEELHRKPWEIQITLNELRKRKLIRLVGEEELLAEQLVEDSVDYVL